MEQYVREGRVVPISALAAEAERVLVGMTLDEVLAVFLTETQAAHPDDCAREGYARKLLAFAEDRVVAEDWKTERYWKEGDSPLTPISLWPGDMRTPLVRIVGDDACERYRNQRLSRAVPQTVRLELNFLTEFHAWLKLRGWISETPAKCSVPKKSKGVRTGLQRERAVQFTATEAIEILARIPVFNQRGGRRLGPDCNGPKSFRVRDSLRLMMEAALRPGHVEKLVLGRHYTRAANTLQITADIDKDGKDYIVMLTPAARELLERTVREDEQKIMANGGLIFGAHEHETVVKAAASIVLGAERGRHVSAYDFRHATGRETMKVTGGDLGAVQAAMKHTTAKTTTQYLAPDLDRGQAALLAASEARLALAEERGIDLSRENAKAVSGFPRTKKRPAMPSATHTVRAQ